MATDVAGNSFVTGYFQDTVDFDPSPRMEERVSSGGEDIFLASYDATGHLRFVNKIGGAGRDRGYAVAIDVDGNVYVTGYFEGTVDFDPSSATEERTSNGGRDIFVASYGAAGSYRFAFVLGGSSFDEGHDIALDQQSNVFITGFFSRTVDFDPGPGMASRNNSGVYVASYDGAGNFRFATGIGSGRGEGVAVDEDGNSYITGFFRGTVDFDPGAATETRTSSGSRDIFTASYDVAGDLRFVSTAATVVGAEDDWASDYGRGVAVDNSGNIYVTGYFHGTVDFDPGPDVANAVSGGGDDAFVASYDPAGGLRFVFGLGGTSTDYGFDIAVDGSDNFYVTGSFQGTVDFDPSFGTEERMSNGGDDAYIASYDAAGEFRFVSVVNNTSSARGYGLGVDSSGSSYVTGTFVGDTDLDPGPGTDIHPGACSAAGCTNDIFVLDLLPNGALPVELAAFSAQTDDGDVLLRWQTVSETNNAGFELQYRADDVFEAVSFVEGHGTTTEVQSYEHRIDGLAPGRHVFRLKQVDLDGAFDYSAEVEVTVGVPGTHLLSAVYPNPLRATAHFTLAVATAQDVRIEAFDLLGRRVALLHEGELASNDTHRFAFEAAALPSGVYVLRVRGEAFAATRRVTVLR